MNWAQPTISGAMMWVRDEDIEGPVNSASSCRPGKDARRWLRARVRSALRRARPRIADPTCSRCGLTSVRPAFLGTLHISGDLEKFEVAVTSVPCSLVVSPRGRQMSSSRRLRRAPAGNDIYVAMEGGEVECRCGVTYVAPRKREARCPAISPAWRPRT